MFAWSSIAGKDGYSLSFVMVSFIARLLSVLLCVVFWVGQCGQHDYFYCADTNPGPGEYEMQEGSDGPAFSMGSRRLQKKGLCCVRCFGRDI